jgi:hypothetical protein
MDTAPNPPRLPRGAIPLPDDIRQRLARALARVPAERIAVAADVSVNTVRHAAKGGALRRVTARSITRAVQRCADTESRAA